MAGIAIVNTVIGQDHIAEMRREVQKISTCEVNQSTGFKSQSAKETESQAPYI